ncbi:small serum protein 2-like [Eublepharis macularius]|uniref:Small serum protein 2-like n=1 Tax=Eublepharis macularius TaxID=481883 RepID=A0AA97KEP1_EUBMA|nr:small serum protein 2-like [Eublepharis macularius]
MKVLLPLTVSCITLALCQAACFLTLPTLEIRNGAMVPQDGCIDAYDKKKYPFESEWNTAHCLRCSCRVTGMECCTRFGGIADVQGCNGVVDFETCTYKFYSLDNPEEPCFEASETKSIHISDPK